MEIASAFNIDIADLRAPLDAEEMSRMTIEDEYTLIIVDVPIKEERNNQTYYVTIPLGIILTEEAIIDLLGEIAASRYLYQPTLAEFLYLCGHALSFRSSIATLNSTCQRFVPDRKSEQIESQLHKSTRNEELIELMELEKNHRLL